MANPAFFIVSGIVIFVAAAIAVFTSQPQPMQGSGYGSHNRPYSPPPPTTMPFSTSPSTRKRNKRGKSPERYSSSGSESTGNYQKCKKCDESPYVKIYPCGHDSPCKNCLTDHLKTKNTCPDCDCIIDRCLPTIPSCAKCNSCRKFKKLINLLPCNHSLSICIACFEKEGKGYMKCPKCQGSIVNYEPTSPTYGFCEICDKFTPLPTFLPCRHAGFCLNHANQYLKESGQQCYKCGCQVLKVTTSLESMRQ